MTTLDSGGVGVSGIPPEFIEADESGSSLISVINFEIRDGDGNYISVEHLSEERRGVVVGEAIAPYSDEWKDKFAAITASTLTEVPPPEPQYYYIESLRDGISNSTRFTVTSLSIHASVDLYSPATNAWHAGTILEINKSLRLVHIHYSNWADECSEWLDFNSNRIAPAGYYTSQAPTTPYHDYSALLTKALEVYGELPTRNTVKVVINDIVDWCIDYTYCFPSLWVITSDNVWIKLAGTLHPPVSTPYEGVFAPTLTLFNACCHLVHILYDIVIRRQKMPLEEILKHLYLRSYGFIKEDVIYERHEFITEQLTALEPMNYEGSKHKIKSYANCPFMAQLKKTAKHYMRSGKKAFLLSYHTILSDGTKKVTKQSENNHLFEDKVFWMNEKQRGVKIAPFPVPSLILLTQAKDLPILYQCYAMLMNYRNLLHIPVFSVKSLERCLMSPSLHPFVSWLHTMLLKILLLDIDSVVTPFVVCEEPDYKPSHCAILLHPATPSAAPESESIKPTLPLPSTGSWLEALRICMLLRSSSVSPITDSYFTDVLGDLRNILVELSKETEYYPLLGAGEGLTINDVIYQLSTGGYDAISTASSSPSENKYIVNSVYDIYHPLLRRFVEAVLIKIEPSENGNMLEFSLPDWEDVFNVKYPDNSPHIASRDKHSIQRSRSNSITKHFQHGAIVDTIKNILSSLQPQFGDLCDSFLRQFEAMYEVRIILPHNKNLPRFESTCNYWLHLESEMNDEAMYHWLSKFDYDELSYEKRLCLLQWLTDEVVKSSTGRQYLDSVMAFHGNKRKTMEGDVTGIEEVQLRIDPLGVDRDDRVYWHFPCDDHVVIVENDYWRVANREDSLKIIDWLSDKGVHESQLKGALSNLPFINAPAPLSANGGHAVTTSQEVTATPRSESDITPTQKSRKKRKVSANIVYDCVDNIEHHWNTIDAEIPLSIPRRVQLSSQQTLELGIKEVGNRICATSYVSAGTTSSVAKLAGIRIGDQLLEADGEVLYHISNLHNALRHNDGTRKQVLDVLLLRFMNPLQDSMLLKAYESDTQFKSAYDSQVQNDAQLKQIKYSCYLSILNDSPDEPIVSPVVENYPSKLLGCIFFMMQATRFPYAVPPQWRYETCASLVTAAAAAHHQLNSSKASRIALKSSMIDMLLGLENALNQCGRAISEDWVTHRRRHKWILTCRRAVTYAQIAAATASLYEIITFNDIFDSALKLDRQSWEKLVPKSSQVKLPSVGDTVVYYAEGHYAALQAEDKLAVPDTCIDKEYIGKVKALADEHVVYQCVVSNIHYVCGGSRDCTSGKCFPFALYELKIVPTTLTTRTVTLTPPRQANKRLNRLLLRVLGVLMSLPEAHSIIRINDKNYASVIDYPVSLEFMRGKAKAAEYYTCEEFMRDLTTLRENTAYYYKSPAPSERMTVVYEAAQALIDALQPEFNKQQTIDTSITSAHEIPTNLILRVSVRLSEGFPEFLVSDAKYNIACGKTFCLEDDFRMRFATENGEKAEYQGMIIGSKPRRADGFIPWDWLKVEWDTTSDDHFSEVNPWEIEQVPLKKHLQR